MDDPVLFLGAEWTRGWRGAPTDNRNDMVGAEANSLGDAASVLEDWRGVNAACDRTTCVDLFHHRRLARDRSELGDGGVWVMVEARACALWWECGARPGDVF